MSGSSQEFVRSQSDAVILAIGRFVWPMHILSAAILCTILRGHVPDVRLWPWGLWLCALACWQAVICFRGSALARDDAPLGQWPFAFDISAVLLAAGWGWLGFALFPHGNPELQAFIGFMIGGAVLTGTGTHNLHYGMLTLTLICIIPALATRILIEGPQPQGLITASMLLIFMALMLGLGWLLRRFMRRSFALQWEKQELAHALEQQADELKVARQVAEDANAAKSRFLAQASHDLRQPIHSMGLFLAALPRKTFEPRTTEIIGRLEQSVDALSKLFTSLLDVTLLDAGETRPALTRFYMDEVIEDVSTEFAPAAAAASIEISTRPSEFIIMSDPLILRRMIQNLISNAIRHADCTTIEVSARRAALGLYIDIADNGRGIAPADQQRIFEEFSKAGQDASKAGGLGLGLFIVRRLADALQVGVSLSAPEAGGAVFSLGPFEAADEVDADDQATAPEVSEITGGHVLIIDDDAATLEATKAILDGWGWTVDTCRDVSSEQANEMTAPTLIISDFDLGMGRTGLEAVAAIRQYHRAVPALIVSGSSAPEVQDQVRAAGLILLEKPVRPVQLRSAILGVLN